MGSWKQSGRSSRGHSSLVEGPLLQGGPTLFQRFLSSMCTKPRLALISHLDFNLKWKLVCELLQQGCWLQCTHRPWVPKCAQNWGAQWCLLMQIHPGDPSGAYSCRPIHDISVCVTLLFFFPASTRSLKDLQDSPDGWCRLRHPEPKRHPCSQATQVPPIAFWCSHLHFPGEMVPGYFCEVLSSCWTSLVNCFT